MLLMPYDTAENARTNWSNVAQSYFCAMKDDKRAKYCGVCSTLGVRGRDISGPSGPLGRRGVVGPPSVMGRISVMARFRVMEGRCHRPAVAEVYISGASTVRVTA